MSVIYINPFQLAASGAAYDPDAQDYITRVIAADVAAGNTSGLEVGVQDAINAFVLGCKADGIWTAIKASCILAGARTLAGALVPLVGTAPTSYNFVAGDYNRETGLVGDGSTKYLNSNRNNNADPQDSNHNAIWTTSAGSGEKALLGTATETGGYNLLYSQNVTAKILFVRNRSTASVGGTAGGGPPVTDETLAGVSRFSGTAVTIRAGGVNVSISSYPSTAPVSANILVYRRGSSSAFTDARISFYSIGEALDLALLDARVTTLMSDLAAAIP